MTYFPLQPYVKVSRSLCCYSNPTFLVSWKMCKCSTCSHTNNLFLCSLQKNILYSLMFFFLFWVFLSGRFVTSVLIAAKSFFHSSKMIELRRRGWLGLQMHRHSAQWKNNSLRDRDRHIFLSGSKLYPASCLMNEECYLGDKKSACAYRRGLLWGLCQREPRGSPRCLPTSVSGGETLDPADNLLMLFRIGTNFSNVYIILWLLFPM